MDYASDFSIKNNPPYTQAVLTPPQLKILKVASHTWKQPLSIDRGIDKEDVVHIHSGILLSHKKE